jgi:hypothetical protein
MYSSTPFPETGARRFKVKAVPSGSGSHAAWLAASDRTPRTQYVNESFTSHVHRDQFNGYDNQDCAQLNVPITNN